MKGILRSDEIGIFTVVECYVSLDLNADRRPYGNQVRNSAFGLQKVNLNRHYALN
jgi:hypothetical protein